MSRSPLLIDLHLRRLRQGATHVAPQRLAAADALLAEAQVHAYGHGIAEAQLLRAQALWAAMRYDEGLKVVRQAARAAQHEGALDLLAESQHVTAQLHTARGDTLAAFAAWSKSLELSLITGQDELGIEALIGIGNLWMLHQQFDDAQTFHKLAMQQAQRLQLPLLAGKAAICLGRAQVETGQYEAAVETLTGAETLLALIGDATWLAEVHDYRSRAWLELGDVARATDECTAAWLLVCDDELLGWAQTLTLLQQARIALTVAAQDSAALSEAEAALDHARHIAARFELIDFQTQIAADWAQLAEQQQDWKRALAEFKTYRELNLAAMRRYQRAGDRDVASSKLARLKREIDRLINRMLSAPALNTASASGERPLLVERHVWQQRLQHVAAMESDFGLCLIQFDGLGDDPATTSPHLERSRMLWLASLVREDDLLTEFATGLYILLLRPAPAGWLDRIASAIQQLHAASPWESSKCRIGVVQGARGLAIDALLACAQAALVTTPVPESEGRHACP
ncbi:hypothetical protein [Andreprevotia chitinilytica]|uniref:hypothetical protein n=1 Tax=Andreprevotia chitinilytica TaxID=396808 RepID=UPI00054D264F|nr:hypothetical protein [Andreprevotia chitinilytica]